MTKKQFVFIIACYIQGSVLYTMYYYQMIGNEAWIAFTVGALLGLLIVALYGRLCETHRSACLVKLNEEVYGRIPGKIISVFYIYAFLISCSVMMRQTGQFIAGDLLMETDWLLILTIFVLICAWASNLGIKYFASVAPFTCVFMYVFTVFLFLLILPGVKLKYFLPVGQRPVSEYIKTVGLCAAMPFSELSVLVILVPELKTDNEKRGFRKQFALGILAGSPFILITMLRDTLVLGPLLKSFSYPAYEVIRLINYHTLSHIESLYGTLLLFLLFFKSAVLFYCFTKAFAQIFGCQKNIVFTAFIAGLTMLGTQQIASSNIMLIELVKTRIIYVLLAVQVLLPVMTLCVSEIRRRASAERRAAR